MTEEYRDVVGFEGLYKISNIGKIINNRTGIIFNGSINTHGYMRTTLRQKGKRYYRYIHRLVADAFIPQSYNLYIINHKDGIKINNNMDNLERCTQKENVLHCYRELGRVGPNKGKTGSNNHLSKQVIQIDTQGNLIKVWGAAIEAEQELKLSNSSISKVCRGVNKTAGGFKWKYLTY